MRENERPRKSHRLRVFLLAAVAVLVALGVAFGGFLLQDFSSQRSLLNLTPRVVLAHDFPDPSGLRYRGTFYTYSTISVVKGKVYNFPVAKTDNLTTDMVVVGDSMPTLPRWVSDNSGASQWAPDVFQVGDHFVMYFTSKSVTDGGLRCIGAATSRSPFGPFIASSAPLTCSANPSRDNGLIDPSNFVTSEGRRYLLYKTDGNTLGHPSAIYIVPVSDDGLRLAGEPKELLSNRDVANPSNNGSNETATLIEAPNLVQAPDGTFVLFFSGNGYSTDNYFTGYATSSKLLGSYTSQGALLTTATTWVSGPGGLSVVGDGKGEWVVFHGWVARGAETGRSNWCSVQQTISMNQMITPSPGGCQPGYRELYAAKLEWVNGHRPTVPTFTSAPVTYGQLKDIKHAVKRAVVPALVVAAAVGVVTAAVYLRSRRKSRV